MITIEINNQMTEQEEKKINLRDHPEIKFLTETRYKAIATIGKLATVTISANRFEDDLEEEKERAAEICKTYTNGEIMAALALMAYKKENDLTKLSGYYVDLMRSCQDAPMIFYPFIKNEEELREDLKSEEELAEVLKEENIDDIDERLAECGNRVSEYLAECGNQYFYTPLGTLFLNL